MSQSYYYKEHNWDRNVGDAAYAMSHAAAEAPCIQPGMARLSLAACEWWPESVISVDRSRAKPLVYSEWSEQCITLNIPPQHFMFFFRDHPGEPVPEEKFWSLWCKWRLTEADAPTIRLGAIPSGLTSAHLHHPHVFYRPDALPAAQPTMSKHWRQSKHSEYYS